MIRAKETIANLNRVKNIERSSDGYLRLDKNENIIEFEGQFLEDLKAGLDSDFLTTYPDLSELYKKIATFVGVSEEMIYIAAGSDGAIKSIFEVYVHDGDEVVIPHPTYAMYYVYSNMFGAKLKKVHYTEDLKLSAESILGAFSDRTSLICIANPNSPTGTVFDQKELKTIIEEARQRDVLILVDEAYYSFYENSAIEMIKECSNLILTRSFTKGHGLACARLGFAVADSSVIDMLQKVRPIYEVNSFAALAGEIMLDNPEFLEERTKIFDDGKDLLLESLKDLGIPYFSTYANFVLLDTGSTDTPLLVRDELNKHKILVSAGYSDQPLSRCVRVTIGSPTQMKLFIKAIEDVWKKCVSG